MQWEPGPEGVRLLLFPAPATQRGGPEMELKKLQQEERGAAMVEYAMILVLVIVCALSAVSLFADGVAGRFSSVSSQVTDTP